MKKIELITNNSDNISIKQTSDTNQGYFLVSTDVKGNFQTPLVCNDSNFRVIRASEFNKRLQERDWNITYRKYMDSEKNLYICLDDKSDGDGFTNIISDNTNSIVVSNYPTEEDKSSFNEFLNSLKTSGNDKLVDIYNEYNNMNSSEIYLYSVKKNTVDILENSVTIDVIPYNSDIYTSTVDLNGLVGYCIPFSEKDKVTSKVDVGIQYSKTEEIYIEDENSETGYITEEMEKLYTKETTFGGFNLLNNEITNNTPYVENINSDVVIEYVGNIIRVVPTSLNVNECIISNCTITYGKL